MELTLGPEETLLRDTVRRYLEREYDFERRRERMAEQDGFSRATWREMAELGLLAAALPADLGGLGAGPIGAFIVAEAFGRALVVEPYLASIVLGGGVIELAGGAAQRARLAELVAGELLVCFAHDEPAMRYDFADVATRLERTGDGYVLEGAKSVVLHAPAADAIVVSARTGDGLSLALVERGAPGVRLRSYRTPDGLPAADVEFAAVRVRPEDLLGEPGQAWPVLERILDRGAMAVCAEAVGAMDALLARTIAYLGSRQQFGMPLARFQALQHRVADMAIAVEQARSLAWLAAAHLDDRDANAARRHVSAAKAGIGTAAVFVGEQAVQLHGGIGMTEALDVSHYFKRLAMIARTFGDADHHAERYLAASGR